MRAAGYIRVSTEEQRKHGWNLDADRERIKATADAQEWELVGIYDDGGRQGDDPDRPAFNQMLADVDDFDVLIIRDLDRFSRKLAIYAAAVDDLTLAGITLYEFAGDGVGIKHIDLDDEDDRALADVKAVFAQLEKAKIKRRVKQAKSARAEAGLHPGGNRSFGYELVDTGRRGKNDKPIRELRPHPIERGVVVRMFQMAEATSQRKIAAILNAEGLKGTKGARWSQAAVALVLGNPLYIGKIRRRVRGEWVVFDGQHDPIVDEDLWNRVNRFKAMPERRAGGRPMKSAHLLTRGILRCGSCGSGMIPVTKPGRPDVYICRGRRDHGPEFCRQPQVRRVMVDETLLGELRKRYLDIDGARERIRERQASELPLAKAAVEEAERELAKAESRIAKVVRGWQDDVINDEEYARQRAELDAEHDAAQAAVEQARYRVEGIKAVGATTDAEEALLRNMADLVRLVSGVIDEAMDVEALRTVIRQLFESVELCSSDRPFGLGGGGLLVGEHDDPKAGPDYLRMRLRDEMVDMQAWEPIKASLPEKLTSPPPRSCTDRSPTRNWSAVRSGGAGTST
jgi:site-specific DNA recombinase